MSKLKFTEDHEWVRLEEDGTATVGITDHAQELLGDLVFIELPEIGREVEQGEETGVIESVKAAGDIKAPVGGEITATNETLADDPALVNADATGDGWFFKIAIGDASELDSLMDEAAYNLFIAD